jgi:hypothetical protein
MRMIDGIAYMNDGDWVESCTALVEHHDGRWEILDFGSSVKALAVKPAEVPVEVIGLVHPA